MNYVSLISERVKDYSRIRTHPISAPLFSFSPSGCLASKPLSTPLGTVASMKGETRGGQRGQLMPAGWNRERFIPWKQQGRCFLVCRESRASNHPVYFTCDPISLRSPSVERILVSIHQTRSKVDLYHDKADLKRKKEIFHKLRKRINNKILPSRK